MATFRGKKRKTMMDVYKDQASDVGRPSVEPYPDLPEYPEDMSKCSSKKLGRLRSKYVAFLAFANEQITHRKADELWRLIALKRRRAVVAISAPGTKLKQVSRVRTDSEVMKAEKQWFKAKADVIAWTNVFWTIKDYISEVDFEIQRRFQDFKAHMGSGDRPRS